MSHVNPFGRFLSADPVLPDASNLQSYNRYSYVRNNPLKYTDPTGNIEEIVVYAPRDDRAGLSQSGFDVSRIGARSGRGNRGHRANGEGGISIGQAEPKDDNSTVEEEVIEELVVTAARPDQRPGIDTSRVSKNQVRNHTYLLGGSPQAFNLMAILEGLIAAANGQEVEFDVTEKSITNTLTGSEVSGHAKVINDFFSVIAGTLTRTANENIFAGVGQGDYTATSLVTGAAAVKTFSPKLSKKLFGKGGVLNSNRHFRIGFSRKGGNRVFRVGGNLVQKITGKKSIDLFTTGKL